MTAVEDFRFGQDSQPSAIDTTAGTVNIDFDLSTDDKQAHRDFCIHGFVGGPENDTAAVNAVVTVTEDPAGGPNPPTTVQSKFTMKYSFLGASPLYKSQLKGPRRIRVSIADTGAGEAHWLGTMWWRLM